MRPDRFLSWGEAGPDTPRQPPDPTEPEPAPPPDPRDPPPYPRYEDVPPTQPMDLRAPSARGAAS
jgi:hypothetical protein